MTRRTVLKVLSAVLIPGWAAREALATQRTVLRGSGSGKQLWYFSTTRSENPYWERAVTPAEPARDQLEGFLTRHYKAYSKTASQRP